MLTFQLIQLRLPFRLHVGFEDHTLSGNANTFTVIKTHLICLKMLVFKHRYSPDIAQSLLYYLYFESMTGYSAHFLLRLILHPQQKLLCAPRVPHMQHRQ